MSGSTDSKVTQIMERPTLNSAGGVADDSSARISLLIESGEEPRRIFNAIVEAAAHLKAVEASALFLPSDKRNGQLDLAAQTSNFVPQANSYFEQSHQNEAFEAARISCGYSRHENYYHFDIVCLGAPIGTLVVQASHGLSSGDIMILRSLAHHSSVTFERQKLSHTLQHFLDRLEVLNELNQLIASNVGLQRIVKSLARESAFRFAADVALTFLLNEDGTTLEVKGGYGCAPNIVPKSIPINNGILGQVMRLGGHLSVSNMANHPESGLEFLEQLNIRSIDACCLEVRGEPLGAIIIGFRREMNISQNDLTRFEEFCQGAAVAIANAITQERITSYTERLEELVERRTADLAFETARAEEANNAKSRFLANMSHELRTPLTAIVGYSSVLIDGVFGEMTDRQKDALTAVVRSSDHLKKLIDDVLNLARIESGKEEVRPDILSVKDLLTQSHKIMLQQALEKGVQLLPLNLSPAAESASIYADPKHSQQIIINLMSNSVKYTPQGGKVYVNAELLGDKVRISIQDTGVGITPYKLSKLFERFERGDDTYSREQEGTGIGLNLTKRLIELNGGRIDVDSEVGKGSCFSVLLPLSLEDKSTIAQIHEASDTQQRLDGLTSVVVDDNKDTCEVLKHILQASGATVRVANSVSSGISLLNEELPDILLTDLAMPGESGLQLIEHVRKNQEKYGSIPIIVLSACAFERDQDAALEAGASTFIPKPFKPGEVIQSVRQLTLEIAMKGTKVRL